MTTPATSASGARSNAGLRGAAGVAGADGSEACGDPAAGARSGGPRHARGAGKRARSASRGLHARANQRLVGRLGVAGISLVAMTGAVLGAVASDAGHSAFALSVQVQPGDTLSAIAARYHTTVAALAAANGISNPNLVIAGATLQIPGPAPAPPRAAPAPAPSPVPATSVVVRPGDTLSAIAARYHTTVAALVTANHIANANLVYAGTYLVLPAGSSTPTASAAASAAATSRAPSGSLPAALRAHPDRVALIPDFVHAATVSGVPLSLLEALCWWESGWQATALSSAGAIGVCQLEPRTVAYARTLLGQPTLNPAVAADNIAMAAAYLHDLLVRTGGNVNLALAGYYQGLTSVKEVGMLPSTEFYVNGILGYTAIFAAAA